MAYENLTGNWNYPNSIRAGAGRIRELADCCKQLGMKAPLLITDPGLAELPMVSEAVQSCNDAGLNCGLFSNIKGNPNGDNVMDGVAAYKEGSHDGVIAFGGGSGLDAAKAVALMVGQDRPLWDFEDVGDNWTRVNEAGVAPIVAVPTTAGTGSEVGRASVITDEANHVKKIIFHPKMLPALVILDPELTTGLPAKVTAATGMDALSHNLEALCSPFYHPMGEGIAVEGIRLVKEYLPTAVADGNNIDARMQMIVASAMGATAFQKGLGGMHALAHPLGALYDAHHGLLNAILMPYVLKANREVISERIERTARYIGLEDSSFDGFLNWVLALREELGIPHTLAEISIDASQAEKVGVMATEDPSAGGNPIPFTAQEYSNIFTNAVQGVL
ncbi:iron-containing alcohol dehydrogenase [Oceanospirillum sediminis]|uniref:Iron-containing alcohol dehydrogenase n=1 Tax=Oceanospirillum sediminis TaxID=2760088 RepID=A0A839IUV9_9GAMM|nr:iron-containing alcohol dehydrogenase [Oceanospirillum sediminis]MBB1488738.1 iron-containing alcohol dehydrogenase [Oceanospirillum sediminis]